MDAEQVRWLLCKCGPDAGQDHFQGVKHREQVMANGQWLMADGSRPMTNDQ